MLVDEILKDATAALRTKVTRTIVKEAGLRNAAFVQLEASSSARRPLAASGSGKGKGKGKGTELKKDGGKGKGKAAEKERDK